MIHDRSLVSQAKGTCTMTFSDLFLKELNELDDPMCKLQGDSNLELPLNETVRARLKQSLASSDRVIGDIIAEKLDLHW